jgi:tetratricopeptide (TPR) repeat protein
VSDFFYDAIAAAMRAYGARDWAVIAQLVAIVSAVLAAFGYLLFRVIKVMIWAWRTLLAPQSARWPRFICRPSGQAQNPVGRRVTQLRVQVLLRRPRLFPHHRPKGVALVAHGGIGKTTLARMVFNARHGGFEGAFWLDAEDEGTLLTQISAIGDQLDLPHPDRQAPQDRARAVWNAVELRRRPWLIVFDNAGGYGDTQGDGDAPSIKGLNHLMPRGRDVRVIVTSREGDFPETIFRTVKLRALPLRKAAKLLEREAARSDDRKTALEWAEELERMPLLLVLAGGYVRDGGLTLAQARAAFDVLAGNAVAGDYQTKVRAMLDLTLARIALDAQTGPDELALLALLPWLAPEGMDAKLVLDIPSCALPNPKEMWDDIPQRYFDLATDAARLQAAIRALTRRSLAVAEGTGPSRTVALHGITAQILRARDGAQADARRRAAAAVVAASYPFDSDVMSEWPACRRLNPHAAALFAPANARGAEAPAPPASAAMYFLLNQAAVFHWQHAATEVALAYARTALDLKIACLGPDHPEVGIGHSCLGGALYAAGEWAEAVTEHREALRIVEAQGADYPLLGTVLSNLAFAMRGEAMATLSGDARRVRLHEVAKLQRRAYKFDRRRHGARHEWTAMDLNNLAATFASLGDLPRALRIGALALATWRQVLPPGDPRLGISLNNLGSYHMDDRAPDRALPLLTEALAILTDAFAADHPRRVITARWLARCHLAQQAPDVAGAAALCKAYGLDFDEINRDAAEYRPLS